MIDGTTLFNLLTSTSPPTGGEVVAGPFGLFWFILLIIPLRLAARRMPRAALLAASCIWLLATFYVASLELRRSAGPLDWRHFATTGGLLGWLAIGIAWLQLLACWRRRALANGRGLPLGRSAMIALVWVGLHALAMPFWLGLHDLWYPSRMAVLHNIGVAYLMLRLIAWGVSLADNPNGPRRLLETACWLLYPPAMRLGPMLLRDAFAERLAAWQPHHAPNWHIVRKRFALFAIGGAGIVLTNVVVPQVNSDRPDFFVSPQSYSTAELLGVLYGVPVRVYLLLWTYNELAAALAAWIGIRVDDNFNWLPAATSIRDFWRRWHVTLGTWLRNYMYIPLGGNRRHVWLNYAIVFGYCGVWHGPSWSFLVWGLLQAAALIGQRGWDRLRERLGWREHQGLEWRCLLGWVLTVHFAAVTIIMFCDFDHMGARFLPTLLSRFGG